MESSQKITGGILGGIAGGVVFGVLMQMMGMMPMIAAMVGNESVAVGWIVHLIISAGTGAIFGLIFGEFVASYGGGIGYGLVYGFAWWILGSLIAMPILLGMGMQFANAFDATHLMSLMGHLIFGLILGAVYAWYAKSAREEWEEERVASAQRHAH